MFPNAIIAFNLISLEYCSFEECQYFWSQLCLLNDLENLLLWDQDNVSAVTASSLWLTFPILTLEQKGGSSAGCFHGDVQWHLYLTDLKQRSSKKTWCQNKGVLGCSCLFWMLKMLIRCRVFRSEQTSLEASYRICFFKQFKLTLQPLFPVCHTAFQETLNF